MSLTTTLTGRDNKCNRSNTTFASAYVRNVLCIFFSLALLSALPQKTNAQCGVVTNNINNIPAILDPTTGTATIDAAALTGYVNPAGPDCAGYLVFDHNPTNGEMPSAGQDEVTCANVAGGASLWVVVENNAGTAGQYDTGIDNLPIQVTIVVSDVTDPVIDCSTIVIAPSYNTDLGVCTANITLTDPTITENCSYTITYTLSGATTGTGTGSIAAVDFEIGTTTITYTVTDASGRTATCTRNVTAVDAEAPSPSAPTLTGVSAIKTTWNPIARNFRIFLDCNSPSLTSDLAALLGTFQPSFTDNCTNPITNITTTPFPTTVLPCQTIAAVPNNFQRYRLRYSAMDAAGNVSPNVNVFIFISDNDAPIFTNTTTTIDVNVSDYDPTLCEADLSASALLQVTATDCQSITYAWNVATLVGTAPAMTSAANNDAAQIYGVGKYLITYTATDACGNAETFQITLNVIDDVPPTAMNCPANITANTISGDCINTVSWTPPTFSDNCTGSGALTYTVNAEDKDAVNVGLITPYGATATGVFSVGQNTVTYTATDAAGITATCSFIVSIIDNQAPVVLCPPNQTLNTICGSGTIPDFSGITNIADNCPEYTVTQTPAAGVALNTLSPAPAIGVSYTVTINVQDNNPSALQGSCIFSLTLADGQAPTPDVAGAVLPALNLTCGTAVVNAPTASDCGTTIYGVTSSGTNLGANTYQFTPGNYTVIWNYIDAQGNSSSQTQDISIVNDTDAPNAICKNITIYLDATGIATITPADVNDNSTDICDPSPILDVTPFNFTCSNVGNNNVTLSVTDINGNTGTCVAIVTVQDITSPTFTCPSSPTTIAIGDANDITAGDCAYTFGPNAGLNPANIDDNCSASTQYFEVYNLSGISVIDGNSFTNKTLSAGSYFAFWQIDDVNANQGFCYFLIDITDAVAPTITCPANATKGVAADGTSDCVYVVNNTEFLPTVNDNCSISGTFNDFNFGNTLSSEVLSVGTYTVTWATEDNSGNTASCSHVITIVDDVAPTFTACPTNVVINNVLNNCINIVNWTRPNFNDNCDPTLVTVTEAINEIGVQESVDLNYPFSASNLGTLASAGFPVGVTTVSYLATDAGGQTATCAFTVTVKDNQAPDITCPVNQILGSICNTTVVPNYTNLAFVSDNCPAQFAVTQVPAAGTLVNTLPGISATPTAGQSFSVKLIVQDNNPNSLKDSCTFNVTLSDTQKPIPAQASLPTIDTTCGFFIINAPTATDCGTTIYGVPNTGTLLTITPPSYIYYTDTLNLVWTYSDNQGNTTTQTHLLAISEDNQAPVALCHPSISVPLSATGTAAVTVNDIDNGSYDNCGIDTMYINTANFTCSNVGNNIVTMLVKDARNNTSYCQTLVNVIDNIAPTISTAPNDITIACSDAIPAAVTLTTTDNCSGATVSMTQNSTQSTSGCGKYSYTIIREWTAIDASGNVVTADQVITVVDTDAPVFNNVAATMNVATAANNTDCTAWVTLSVAGAVTDCQAVSDVTIANNAPHGNGTTNADGYYAPGIYMITFVATDACGNHNSTMVTLTVTDGTAPVAICINSVSIALSAAGSITLPTFAINDGSFDNCSNVTLAIAPSMFNCTHAGQTVPVQLTVTDQSGNTAFCISNVTIQDNTAPTLSACPPDRTINCNQSLDPNVNLTLGKPIVTDNCGTPMMTYNDVNNINAGSYCGNLVRTWTISDNGGNTVTCVQGISVIDNVAPTISSVSANITVQCGQPIPAVATPTVTDNCDQNITVVLTQDTTNITCGGYNYKVNRTWTATDDCGNTATLVQSVTVQDTQAPSFGAAPTTVNIATTTGANATCTAALTFDINSFITDCNNLSDIVITNNAPHGNGTTNINGTYNVGTYNVIFTATDKCGNSATHAVLITVADNSIPTAICFQQINVSLGSNGTATIGTTQINNGSYDNCTASNMLQYNVLPNTFDCGDLGASLVTLTITDQNGNTNTCQTTVNVNASSGGVNLNVATSSVPTSFFGNNNGSATAVVNGGSGVFTYAWNNGSTTATANGLTAGVYTVMVTDNTTGCAATATATVSQGPRIGIVVGNASGNQGDIISVPISVTNLNVVQSLQFSMHVVDAAVGTLVGVDAFNLTGLSAANFNISGNDLSLNWTNSGAPITLANNTVIFNVLIQLVGTAGNVTPVTINDNPVVAGATQLVGGSTINSPILPLDGTATVNNGSTITVSGLLRTENNLPIPNATVYFTGAVTDSVTTGANGIYTKTVPIGSTITISPYKNTNAANGVTVTDLAIIQQHILTSVLLTTPYKHVAADANKNTTISTIDIVTLRYLILGLQTQIPTNTSWRFVPESFVFPPLPYYANVPTFPEVTTLTNVTTNQSNVNFIGMKVGDENNTANPANLTNVSAEIRNGSLTLIADAMTAKQGEKIYIPVRAKDFQNIMGYQFTMDYDGAALSLLSIQPGTLKELSSDNFAMHPSALTAAWYNASPQTLADGTVLFTLVFDAKTAIANLENVLQITNRITDKAATNSYLEEMDIALDFAPMSNESNAFELFSNKPNPFKDNTTIGFNLPIAEIATLSIYDAMGRLVHSVTADYTKGYHEVQVNTSDLSGEGVYFYHLETATYSAQKSMVIVRP